MTTIAEVSQMWDADCDKIIEKLCKSLGDKPSPVILSVKEARTVATFIVSHSPS